MTRQRYLLGTALGAVLGAGIIIAAPVLLGGSRDHFLTAIGIAWGAAMGAVTANHVMSNHA